MNEASFREAGRPPGGGQAFGRLLRPDRQERRCARLLLISEMRAGIATGLHARTLAPTPSRPATARATIQTGRRKEGPEEEIYGPDLGPDDEEDVKDDVEPDNFATGVEADESDE